MRKNQHHDDDIDRLFQLPLADFTAGRNALVAQLKKGGRSDEAAEIKSLSKPSVSAWAVNQLYWNHRDAFDKLLASGERFHKAQKSGKMSDMRTALDARRVGLKQLSDLAAQLLKGAGHNPAPDTLHRITTTLEGLSVYTPRNDGPQLGRLTHDIDPPGFESVGAFVPGKQQTVPSRKPAESKKQKAEGSRQKAGTAQRRPDQAHEKKIGLAKVSLKEAKQSLAEAQTRVRSLEAANMRAQAELTLAEKRLKEATARAEKVEDDLEDAAKKVKDAEVAVKEATKLFESLSSWIT